MGNLTHTLAGLVLAETGLKRYTPHATITAVIGANLPDIDVFAYFASPVHALEFRRGWTHGILAAVVLPVLLAVCVLAWERARRGRKALGDRAASEKQTAAAVFRGVLLVSALSIWSHPLLDLLNTYGVRLLMPFSHTWFQSDALFIVDPFLWVILVGGIALARYRARGAHDDSSRALAFRHRPARVAIALATGYVLTMIAISAAARASLDQPRGAHGLMVSPTAARRLVKFVVRDIGGHYELGVFSWLENPRYSILDTVSAGPLDEIRERAGDKPQVRAFLSWARFPRAAVTPMGDSLRVLLTDVRYSGGDDAESWASAAVTIP
jgi:inner membrane protein